MRDRPYRRFGAATHAFHDAFRHQQHRLSTFTLRIKKCFVCDKSGCWFINHSQRDRDTIKKRFDDRFPQYKNNQKYDRFLQQWIINYENDQDEEKVVHFFKNLMIETSRNEIFNVSVVSSNDDVNEVFSISIGTVDATESFLIIKDLANAILRHRIIVIDEISLITFVSYVFNFTIDTRYDFSEFKGLLIDSKTTSRFTKNMKQLQTLQHLNPSIKFDFSTVESASFIFEMNSIVSIESVNLETSIEPIIFHIIGINIFFLLNLADLDKADAYFNNVINRLIQKNQFHSIV